MRAKFSSLISPIKTRSSAKKISNITQLPNEILSRIVSSVNVYHRQKIRASCKRFKSICDGQVLHEFRKELNKQKHSKKFSSQALRAIDIISKVYLTAGLESVFAGTLMSFVSRSYRTPFVCNQRTLKPFVRNFVRLADEQVPGPKGIFLYTAMILNLLKVSFYFCFLYFFFIFSF